MTDPEHLHDLTDEEWHVLESHRGLAPYEARIVAGETVSGLQTLGLLEGFASVTPSGRAHLDKVEVLARHVTGDHGGAIYLWDDFELRTDTPLGRAVLRAYERGQG